MYPPALVKTLNGTYAVFDGTWYPVNTNTTLQQIRAHWIDSGTKYTSKKPKSSNDWIWKVKNSKGNGEYTITFDSRGWNCNCAGYGFRRSCRHVDEIKAKI